MADNDAAGVVGGVLAVGAVYLVLEWTAAVALGVFLGIAAAIVLVGVISILGVVVYVRYAAKAIRGQDWGWLFDIMAAPVGSFLAVVAFHGPIFRMYASFDRWSNGVNNAHPDRPGWGQILIPLGLVAIVIFAFFVVPILAIRLMGRRNRWVRSGAYLCFLIFALTWGAVIAYKIVGQPVA